MNLAGLRVLARNSQKCEIHETGQAGKAVCSGCSQINKNIILLGNLPIRRLTSFGFVFEFVSFFRAFRGQLLFSGFVWLRLGAA
jgi:hypothetical protein